MSFSIVTVNGKPNSQDLKTIIMDSESDLSILPLDVADGSSAYTKDLSHIYNFLNGTWVEAGGE
jgi:hypothetical protein